jgi:hypothetical protein
VASAIVLNFMIVSSCWVRPMENTACSSSPI